MSGVEDTRMCDEESNIYPSKYVSLSKVHYYGDPEIIYTPEKKSEVS